MKNKLDKFEKDLESKIESSKSVSKKRKEEIYKLLEETKAEKTTAKIPITIRLDKGLLTNIKQQASNIGIGYQTLISIVLREKYSGLTELRETDNYKLIGELENIAAQLKSNLR
ncbi:CopG family antitoxin [Leptospira kirschneri]|uniref:CopG family antitoxin n=1 Tax=Leptospira kirschneri TaxID=29507 RepID=UPI00046C7395|nr:CopG family antitoxin [Leptospira kirschneri]